MPALGVYAENLVINALVRATNLTAPTTVWLALYTTDPTAADVGTEIPTSGGSNYARQIITFGAPSGGISSNSADVPFPQAGSIWGTITHAAIRDASTGGNLLFYGALITPRSLVSGDVIKFITGNVVITLT